MRNAIAYYNRLISTKSLTDCTAAIVRDKVRHLQKKYAEAIRWTNETGQGIRDSESEATFDSVTLRRYPHFQMADEIWGSKTSIHVPVKTSSDQIGPVAEDEDNFPLPFVGSIAKIPVTTTTSGNNVGGVTIEEVENDGETIDELPVKARATPTTTNKLSPTGAKFLATARDRFRNGAVIAHNSRDAYTAVSKLRFNVDLEKLDFQKEQLKIEKEKNDQDQEFRREKFEFEKDLQKAELELRRRDMDNQQQIRLQELESKREIRLKELEIEKLKLELSKNH